MEQNFVPFDILHIFLQFWYLLVWVTKMHE